MDNVATHLQRLQLGGRRRQRVHGPRHYDPHACMRRLLTQSFCSRDDATFQRQNAASGCATPVFQGAFARTAASRLLAAVDEDGVVSLIDTAAKGSAEVTGVFQRVHHKWLAHDNAIFDLAWTRDDAFLLTAAGDLRATAWDVATQRAVFTLSGGHSMSVKCVRPSDDHTDVIATGARDGHVLLWDARTPTKPVAQLRGVHSVPTPAPSASQTSNVLFVSPAGSRKRRKPTAASTAANSSPRSVTSVAFLGGGNELATAGAVDGVVKIWDLRRLTAQRKIQLQNTINSVSTPLRSFACGSARGGHRGITSLAVDPVNRSKLLVSVLHDELCVLDVHARTDAVRLRLEGHVASSFYVKAAFSPDGDYVVSGSGDGNVYVWETSSVSGSRRSPVLALRGHDAEVNGVAWHESDFTKLATCSDDGTVRVWTADRHAPPTAFALRRKHQRWENACDLEDQERGRAYAVESVQEEVIKPEPASPPVVRRPSSTLTTTPEPTDVTPRKRQTLLDYWQR